MKTSTEVYLSKIIKRLLEISQGKKQYLIKLKELKNGGYDKIKEEVFTAPSSSLGYVPFILNNQRKLDHLTFEIWGEFFLEALDPCHQRLMTYYDIWRKKILDGKLPDFFIWLEDKNVSRFFPQIDLFDGTELKSHEATIKEGKLYYLNGMLVHQPDPNKEAIVAYLWKAKSTYAWQARKLAILP